MTQKLKFLQSGSLVLALIFLVWQLMPTVQIDAKKSQDRVPDWFGIEVSVTEMDETGNPKRSFSAARLTHYTDEKITDMVEPSFTLIPESKIPWRLTAAQGRTFHGETTTAIDRLDLWDDVTVWQPKETTATPMRMLTSALSIYPDTALAQTDARVVFDQPGHQISGQGMRANFNDKSIELLDNIRSEHVRQPRS
jgi:LPS export ABC transporter protein LptC